MFYLKRNNEWQEVAYKELVIGDQVKCGRGKYPFSALFFEGKAKVDESYVNGENYVD